MEERLGDPLLVVRARTLRAEGLSWTQIAERLGVGRTTARRLCQNPGRCAGDEVRGEPVGEDARPRPAFQNGSKSVPSVASDMDRVSATLGSGSVDTEETKALPEVFRLFAALLERALEAGRKPK